MQESSDGSYKVTLHYVGGDAHERASFAQAALSTAHHCELYDNLSELAAYPPRNGFIFVQDDPAIGGISHIFERLEALGIWLPIIAVGKSPAPQVIVESIKAGALDYIVLPVEADRLERCLARNATEAQHSANLRRKKVEAQERLSRLSRREAEVLQLLAEGHSNKLIARDLGISPRTVEIHRANMMNKLGATHSAGAVRLRLEARGVALA